MHNIPRRLVLASGLAALSLATLPLAWSQDFPSKSITIVVPYTPGSGTDQLARLVAQALTAEYKVPVVIDNKPGASGFIGAQHVARAAPDGYTWFLTGNTTQSANEHLFRKLPYDPVRDFTPVSLMSKGYMVLVVSPSSPVKTVDELVALARKSPGKLNFGSGTASGRIAGEMLRQMAGIDVAHVPYKSNPPALLDLLAGQVDFMFTDAPTAVSQVTAGKLRALGVTSTRRLEKLANVPTMQEAGLKGYEWAFWLGMYLPPGAPAPLVQRVNAMLHKVAEHPQYKAFHANNAGEVAVSTPEGLARFQAAESEKTGRIVRAAGIVPD